MINKKVFIALMALTAAVGVSARIKSKRLKKPYSSEETLKQAWEYKKAINNVLTKECLRNFSDFASALSEYYGITAKCCDCKTIEYSSGKYPNVLTSDDVIRTQGNAEIRLECMSDLEDYFLFNRTDTTGHLPEHYSPFYYGNHMHRGEPVMLKRSVSETAANGVILGIAGGGHGIHPWDNLKRCPKCGSYPWFVGKDGKDFYSGSPYKVICSNHDCDCQSIQSDSIEQCREDWNT